MTESLIVEIAAAIAASIYGIDKIIPHVRARKAEKKWNGNGKTEDQEGNGHILMDKKAHDEICTLRLKPIQDDLKELKSDVKILIGRH